MPATDEVVPEGRVLTYDVDMALGDSFLAIPEALEEGDYEPPDWFPSGDEEEDEAPPAEREAEAAMQSPRPVMSPRGAWRPASPPARSAATTRAADKQYYKDLLAEQHENIKLEKQCLLAKLEAAKQEVTAQKMVQEAAQETLRAAQYFRQQCEILFDALGQAMPTKCTNP